MTNQEEFGNQDFGSGSEGLQQPNTIENVTSVPKMIHLTRDEFRALEEKALIGEAVFDGDENRSVNFSV